MAPPDQFPDQVDRLGRAPAAGRKVRFMGKESQAHGMGESGADLLSIEAAEEPL